MAAPTEGAAPSPLPLLSPRYSFRPRYYLPDYKLHVPVSNMENDNTREDLERQTQRLLQQLSHLEAAPNVQIQTGQPGVRRAPAPRVRRLSECSPGCGDHMRGDGMCDTMCDTME